MFDRLSSKFRIKLIKFLLRRLKVYKIIQTYKAQKKSYKQSLPSFWQTTMTKRVVWISIILTISLWIIDISLIFLASPTLLSIPETAVIEFTSSCRQVTVGMFATIVFYFIRAFMDSWNKARTKIDVSDEAFANMNNVDFDIDEINESVSQMIEETKERII